MARRGLDHPYLALPPPWLVAHRGGSLLAPENTLPAFEQAEALGADVIETDVRLSRDGVVMVFHDADTARITGRPGTIEGRTRAELEGLDAAFGFSLDGGRTFPWRGRSVRIPVLADVLARFPRMRFNVEAKGREAALAEALARVLEAAGREDSVAVGAADGRQARRLARLLPRYARYPSTPAAMLHFLASRWRWLAFLGPAGHDLAALPVRWHGIPVATPRLIRYFHGRRMAVQFWTVDDEAGMRRLLALGADGIMSDRPDLLKRVLGRGG